MDQEMRILEGKRKASACLLRVKSSCYVMSSDAKLYKHTLYAIAYFL